MLHQKSWNLSASISNVRFCSGTLEITQIFHSLQELDILNVLLVLNTLNPNLTGCKVNISLGHQNLCYKIYYTI